MNKLQYKPHTQKICFSTKTPAILSPCLSKQIKKHTKKSNYQVYDILQCPFSLSWYKHLVQTTNKAQGLFIKYTNVVLSVGQYWNK